MSHGGSESGGGGERARKGVSQWEEVRVSGG